MTTEITEDLLGGTARLSLSDGWTATRLYFANGVVSSADAVQFQAIQNGDIPNTGDPHPTIPLAIVDNITASSVGLRQVKLTINYKVPKFGNTSPDEESQTQIVISGTVQTVQTNKHIVLGKEKLIILKYSYPEGEAPDGVDSVKKVVATIDKQIPLIVASLSRRESEDPAQKSFDNVGRLNSRTFIGGRKGLWMCTKIGGPSSDGGQTFQVTYEFMRKQGGWNTDVLFTDERTGKIPVDVESQPDALLNVTTQETADFTKLDLGPFSK